MTTLSIYAQPYQDAEGFHFSTVEEYRNKAAKNFDPFGQLIEEYQHIIIDGDLLECNLWQAMGGDGRASYYLFLKILEELDDETIQLIIARYKADTYQLYDSVQEYVRATEDMQIYYLDGFGDPYKQLAEQFVDEGLFGDIPSHLENYIDYDAIGRDLKFNGYVHISLDSNQDAMVRID